MKPIRAMSFEDLRNLIGRKVEWQLFQNGVEKKPLNDLSIQHIGIYSEYVEIQFWGRECEHDPNLDIIYLGDEEFESFLKGNEYKPPYNPDFEDIYRLKDEKFEEDGKGT